MKFLIALLIAIPTLIAILLFTVAGLSFHNPALLAASSNPVIAILCIISGVIAALPFVLAVIFWLGGLLGLGKKKKDEAQGDKEKIETI
ncbi:MAG: hypothetical protein E7545_03865 [Ruminococcaceae bacterium]|nr:hypothetical protein [Oscillospiraceae bacterium]